MLNLGKMYRQIKPPDRGVSLHEGSLGSRPSTVMISSLSGGFGALSVSKVIFCWSEKTKNSTPHSVHIVVRGNSSSWLPGSIPAPLRHLPLLEPKLERTTAHNQAQAQESAVQACASSEPGQIPVPYDV